MQKSERLNRFSAIDVYPVITGAFCAGRDPVEVCRQALKGGARIVQLREKDKTKRELTALAGQFREITREHDALLIINDHLDIALGVEADGVHLGQDDLPLAMARRLAPELLIGISTHSLDEAKQAEAQAADYVNFGPIFQTQTKAVSISPLLTREIPELSEILRIPFTVMGGIKMDNLEQVVKAGATRIAMVTEITQAENVAAAVKAIRQAIRRYQQSSASF